jgi:transcriptional regulator with XRE-family HTH domain
MTSTSLSVLRLALPGSPSSREIARQIGCSQQLLHKFERGEGNMSERLLVKYAKLVGHDANEIRKRWLHAALEATRQRRLELLAELKDLSDGARHLRRGRRSA